MSCGKTMNTLELSFHCHIITVDFYACLSTVENDKSFSLNIILKDYNHFLELAHNCRQKWGRWTSFVAVLKAIQIQHRFLSHCTLILRDSVIRIPHLGKSRQINKDRKLKEEPLQFFYKILCPFSAVAGNRRESSTCNITSEKFFLLSICGPIISLNRHWQKNVEPTP